MKYPKRVGNHVALIIVVIILIVLTPHRGQSQVGGPGIDSREHHCIKLVTIWCNAGVGPPQGNHHTRLKCKGNLDKDLWGHKGQLKGAGALEP